MTREQIEILETTDMNAAANVFGYIEFSKTDRDHKKGYLLQADIDGASNQVTLQLLRANI